MPNMFEIGHLGQQLRFHFAKYPIYIEKITTQENLDGLESENRRSILKWAV